MHTSAFKRAIGEALGIGVGPAERLGGGDVSDAYRVELDDGTVVFAKTHRAPPPNFFGTEAAGLGWLAESAALPACVSPVP